MTFEKILSNLRFDTMSVKEARKEITKKEKLKKINFYSHISNITKEPLNDSQLQELSAIVEVLQILENSKVGSPISDTDYDNMQELLVDMGIPRLTGTLEINDNAKVSHKYTTLRGTLGKTYYLSLNEKRSNKSRKYLDEWIKSAEAKYEKVTGKKLDFNTLKILCQPKFDGASAILEVDTKPRWITRGDTTSNRASDVTHILNIFNDIYANEEVGTGIKFEIMITEENKDKINELYRNKDNKYHNSRQIVTAALNSNEPDFKADYLYPVPLRIIHEGDQIEQIHPDLMKNFPTMICTFGDRDMIRQFAYQNKYVNRMGMRFRTDGVVMTILDPNVQMALGRENNINNFEVAYKFTEEVAYTKVRDVIFEVSEFGYICPVLLVNDVIMKGNTINRISLSNKERFDELNFSYGDTVKVLYDIIPYVTVDEMCHRVPNGRKIEFIDRCPRCHEPLDLNVTQVRCMNKKCPSRIIGKVQNFCTNLRIQNIGYQTLETLWIEGLLNDGILSLYKLKKKKHKIEDIEGFGKAKTRKIVNEIEAKRRLKDYEFFGALGIDGLSTKTFRIIFDNIKLSEFINMIKLKNFDLMKARVMAISGIGESKTTTLIEYLNDNKAISEINKLMKEITLYPSFGSTNISKGRIVFTGCRPSDELSDNLINRGWEPSDSWSDKTTKYLVIPKDDYESSKVTKANDKGIKVITLTKFKQMINEGII